MKRRQSVQLRRKPAAGRAVNANARLNERRKWPLGGGVTTSPAAPGAARSVCEQHKVTFISANNRRCMFLLRRRSGSKVSGCRTGSSGLNEERGFLFFSFLLFFCFPCFLTSVSESRVSGRTGDLTRRRVVLTLVPVTRFHI